MNNKKLKITALIGLAAILVGSIMGLIGWYGNDGKFDTLTYDHGFHIEKYVTRQDYDVKDVKNLELDTHGSDVIIKRGNDFGLKTRMLSQDRVTVKRDGNHVTIKNQGVELKNVMTGYDQPTITLTVPVDYPLDELNIKVQDGTLDISKLKVEQKTEIQNIDGGIILNHVDFKNGSIRNDGNGTRLEGGNFQQMEFINNAPFRAIKTNFMGDNTVKVQDDEAVLIQPQSNLAMDLTAHDGNVDVQNQKELQTQRHEDGDFSTEKVTFGQDDENKLHVIATNGDIHVSDDEE
ncbi:hypothetical protein ACJQWY_03660 [Weissella kandleri]|uniref:hypothetical protein n=1 Tax=Weissella kandleri TaxID=1616 RepID=UPI00387E595A